MRVVAIIYIVLLHVLIAMLVPFMYNKRLFNRVFRWRGVYKNIASIPQYFKAQRMCLRNGFLPYAFWQTNQWFIDTMHDILVKYRHTHCGYPINMTASEWDTIIDKMIELLSLMDEDNPVYQDEKDYFKVQEDIRLAKNEFFSLFSQHFDNLWD